MSDDALTVEEAAVRAVALWLRSTAWMPLEQAVKAPEVETGPLLAGALEHPGLHAAVAHDLHGLRTYYLTSVPRRADGRPPTKRETAAQEDAMADVEACNNALAWLEAHPPKA